MVVILNLFLIVIAPISLIFTYGFAVKATNFSWSLYWIVVLVMSLSLHVLYLGETDYGVPLILADRIIGDNFNYTGKELIYDKFPSLMWVLSITMSSNGTTNACLENYSPLSTIFLFSNLVISKFIMEGVGSGFFAMLAYLIVSVFLRGLITGDNSNFFGKKITINEINYVVIVFLIMPVGVLLFTGITFALPETKQLITYQGSQAVTDIAYNFVSNFTNNGSNFAGLNTANNYFNYMSALAMFIGRYPVIYYSLAISGSFASKRKMENCTKNQNQSSFDLSFFLLITVLIVGAIMFMPLMILGPILEFINM
jgi:K+-transporting ATPase ATPase A chain